MNAYRCASRPGKFLSLMFCALVLAACGRTAPSPDEALKRARELQGQFNYGAAVIELKAALKAAPDFKEGREMIGQLYVKLGDGNSAEKELTRAVELGANAAALEPTIITALLLRGDSDKALARAQKLDPKSPMTKVLLAEGRRQLGKLDEARSLLDEALKAEPDNVPALLGIARVATDVGDFKAAQEFIAKALAKDSNEPAAWMLDAETKMSLMKPADAIASFDKASKLNTLSAAPLFGKVRAYLGSNQTKEADEILKTLKARMPKNPTVTFYQGVSAFEANRFDEATDRFREVLGLDPNHAVSQMYLAQLLFQSGKLEQAEELMSRVIVAFPDYKPGRRFLASIQLKRDKPDAAIATLETLGDALNSDASLAALSGNAYLAAGKLDKGVDMLKKAVALEPQNQVLKSALVLAQLRSGKGEQAVDMLQADLKTDSNAESSGPMLLYALINRKEWDQAISTAKDMLAKKADDPATLNALGLAYVARQKYPEARETFTKALKGHEDFTAAWKNLITLDLAENQEALAREHVAKLMAREPKSAFALTTLGRLELKRKKWREAVDYFEQARAADPKDLEVRLVLAKYYVDAGDYEKALAASNEALNIDPKSGFAIATKAKSLLLTNKLAEAEALSGQLLAAQPAAPTTQSLAAIVALRLGRIDEAKAQAAKVPQDAPERSEALGVLVAANLGQGDVAGAQRALQELSTLEGETPQIQVLRGDVAARKGDWATAEGAYAQAVANGLPDTASTVKLSRARWQIGRRDDAIKLLEDWVAKHPKDLEALFGLAQVEELAGKTDAAAATYGKVLAVEPNFSAALNNLALIKLAKGDSGAAALAEKALSTAPDDPNIMDTYGWVQLQNGQNEAALKLLEAAARKLTSDPDVGFHYAAALAKTGQRDEAAKVLARALKTSDFVSRKQAQELQASLQGAR